MVRVFPYPAPAVHFLGPSFKRSASPSLAATKMVRDTRNPTIKWNITAEGETSAVGLSFDSVISRSLIRNEWLRVLTN